VSNPIERALSSLRTFVGRVPFSAEAVGTLRSSSDRSTLLDCFSPR
jgi:hypothetical protein